MFHFCFRSKAKIFFFYFSPFQHMRKLIFVCSCSKALYVFCHLRFSENPQAFPVKAVNFNCFSLFIWDIGPSSPSFTKAVSTIFICSSFILSRATMGIPNLLFFFFFYTYIFIYITMNKSDDNHVITLATAWTHWTEPLSVIDFIGLSDKFFFSSISILLFINNLKIISI